MCSRAYTSASSKFCSFVVVVVVVVVEFGVLSVRLLATKYLLLFSKMSLLKGNPYHVS